MKIKIKQGLFFLIVCLLFCSLSLDANNCTMNKKFIGEYTVDSESEWGITLYLQADYALIVHEAWMPGEYEKREKDSVRAKWCASGNLVSIKYDQVMEKFLYSEDLPLSELGMDNGGFGVGLSPVKPIDKNAKIGGYILWEAKGLHKLFSNE